MPIDPETGKQDVVRSELEIGPVGAKLAEILNRGGDPLADGRWQETLKAMIRTLAYINLRGEKLVEIGEDEIAIQTALSLAKMTRLVASTCSILERGGVPVEDIERVVDEEFDTCSIEVVIFGKVLGFEGSKANLDNIHPSL